MGYTVRVDKFRYTAWFPFNQTLARPLFAQPVATELYAHDESPLPIRWDVEHANVVGEAQYAATVQQLHSLLLKCGQRPDLCPNELTDGLVP